MEKYPGQIRLVYHHYPDTDYAYLLAEVLEAAGQQDKLWELHDSLAQYVPDGEEELMALMESIGLDMDRVGEALQSYEYRGRVDLAKQEAKAKGVTEVALFINGKEYQKYPGTFDDLCQAIEQELERLEASSD